MMRVDLAVAPRGRLTRQAGDSVEKTILAGVPSISFFAALAKLDTSRLALTVLPYRVTR